MKLDKFHYHEMSDRLYMIESILNKYLSKHPVAKKHGDIWNEINEAKIHLLRAYQMMAKYDQDDK